MKHVIVNVPPLLAPMSDCRRRVRRSFVLLPDNLGVVGPSAAEFEQGATLGRDAQGWRRAKSLARFRMFFRFHSASKVIAIAWVNDENTLRKAAASSDPYKVFRGMLVSGNPPSAWDALVEACRMPPNDPARGLAEAALGPMGAVDDLGVTEPTAAPATSKRKKRR